MKFKRTASIFLSLSLFLGSLPISTLAESVAVPPEKQEETHSAGQIGGYLSGKLRTTEQLFAERKFTISKTGSGFAAERGNNLIDRLTGHNASVVGDNNVKNGPDRKIINRSGRITWIQDKYYQSAAESLNAAFDSKGGVYRYVDGDGKPMALEVPSDQYEDAIRGMRKKIEDGRVPGVTDPNEASKIVKKGHLTYDQAKNLTKAGTIESLAYDAVNGTVTATCAAGISFAIDYVCCRLNGQNMEVATKNAGLNGLKTGGIVFATYVISSQLAKTGLPKLFVPTADAISKKLGSKLCTSIAQQSGLHASGQAAVEQVSKIIAKDLLVDGVMILVLTSGDVADLFQGRISKEELLKNLTVTVISVAAGTAGYYGGGALGTLIAPGVGTIIGKIVGPVVAGTLSVWAAESLIAPYYESDAEEMFKILSDEFTNYSEDYLISEEEGNRLTEALQTSLDGDVLKDMYASENRKEFAQTLLEPLFTEVVEKRPTIEIPTEESLRNEMKTSLQGIVFIH